MPNSPLYLLAFAACCLSLPACLTRAPKISASSILSYNPDAYTDYNDKHGSQDAASDASSALHKTTYKDDHATLSNIMEPLLTSKDCQHGLLILDEMIGRNVHQVAVWAWKGIMHGLCAENAGGLSDKAWHGSAMNKAIQKALEIDPNDALALFAAGQARLHLPSFMGGDIPTALAYFEAALRQQPAKALRLRIMEALAATLKTLGREAEALTYEKELQSTK